MSEHKHTNQLIHETSPYLLQHAHNPVNWFAWNDDALQKSKAEDKPILVSIGYSACHWCHVMERESFEDEATAQIMNEHFINIKIDREERPDIDHIYMDAVQAISGSGGWPLNVFLTPDLKPFYGGTYFPPVNMYNRSSWRDVLLTVMNAYKEKKDGIHAQADALTEHLQNTNLINTNNITSVENESLNIIATNLLKIADNEWGGFGQAPKFPQTFSILYLLRHSFFTNDENALNAAVLSLGKMMMGGIYDHLGGGFCRYSTDRRWQIPHFEKMLYDNALLIEVYTEAFQLTKNNDYALVVDETIKFIQRELTSSQGGFYSALDADSEGVEGKYYTWSKKEIDDLLGEKSKTFCNVYNVLEEGNWEHTNILWMPDDVDTASEKFDFDKEEFLNDLPFLKATLFKARQIRIRPNLDDKVLLSWNALAITALCKAYAVFDNELYLQMAETNIIFIEKYLFNSSNELLHSWNKITNQQPAFLDDYATLIRAYISLHEVSANTDYLLKAKALTQKTIELFSDEEELFFYFTSKTQKDVLLRKTDYYDGATPSGNSLMATNLILLSVFFDISDWNLRAEKMIMRIKHLSEKYPTSFGIWNLNLQLLIYKLKEIVVTGNDFNKLIKQILQEYIPLKIIQSSYKVDDDWPLLKGKQVNLDNNKIYICENYNCREPATNFESFQKLLNQHF